MQRAAAEFVQAGIHVRAPRTSAEWLSPEGVRQYWATSLPQLPPGKPPGLRDGKKCFFTADNFFHADQFSGSGGWSGRNRSWPAAYAASAQTVLDAKPDWVLAEHGGAFEFNAEDFRRRVQWGRAAALAADKLSPGSDHRSDWNPTRISIEPLLRRATQQQALTFTLVIENSKNAPRTLTVELEDRAVALPYKQTFPVAANTTLRHEMRVKLVRALLPGRHVFPLTIREGNVEDPADVFLVIEIPP